MTKIAARLLCVFALSLPLLAQEPKTWTTAEDHQQMMAQLGIRKLRPGPSGQESAPNQANYDESKANPFPILPDALTLKSGTRVTTPAMWWKQRRPEIVEDFEREVVGRIPRGVPGVKWSLVSLARGTVGGRAVVGRQLVGRVADPKYPALNVNIQMTLVTPADAPGPVPVMIMFGSGVLPQSLGGPAPARRGGPPPGAAPAASAEASAPRPADPSATEQLIAAGWGFASLSPTSIQADNGAGLTRGIIGFVNKGQPRKPDDWGSLRAWAWGASRALDYFESEASVDARRVGIEGVSRYGKAALITMAFDQRFAVVLVGSSGEGGAKLHRRNWGEQVENLTGAGEYHWMAGNFLKYGAAEADFGSKTAGDIPVDAHQLLALCAPRPTFVSYGVPERGDARWLDHQGSYMAAVAAGPVFRLLGAKDLGTSDDYRSEKMPAVNVSMLEGQLAWRQHDGGHTDQPNWKYFIPWADRMLGRARAGAAAVRVPADRPVERTDENSRAAHAELLEKARRGRTDVYFVGDSITRRWGATDYPELLAHWTRAFHGWNAANFGWGADTTAGMSRPKGEADRIGDVTRGVKAIVDTLRAKAPAATIVLTAIFPRNDNIAVMPVIDAINRNISAFADGKVVRYVNVNGHLADPDGKLHDGMTHDGLHPTIRGYQVWADALTPIFTELLGPPAKDDQAPPPTGDPRAKRL